MANVDAPYGFRPLRHYGGGNHGRTNPYTIVSGYDANIFMNDLVKSAGNGSIVVGAATDTHLIGVFQGCEYTNAAGDRIFSKYWPANTVATEIVAHVIDDPQVSFIARASGSIVANDVGLLADLDATTAGSTATGESGMAVGAHDGSEGQLKILRLLTTKPTVLSTGKAGFPAAGNFVDVEVLIAEHELRGTMTEV